MDPEIITLSEISHACMLIQTCPTLCDPMDNSLPGSLVHWILQARIVEWVATPFSEVSHTKTNII